MTDDSKVDQVSALLESIGLAPKAKFKVLTFFLQQPPSKQFFLNEIAEATGLTATSVKNAVEQLREEGHLDRIDRGAMKFYEMTDTKSKSADGRILKTVEELRKIIQR